MFNFLQFYCLGPFIVHFKKISSEVDFEVSLCCYGKLFRIVGIKGN